MAVKRKGGDPETAALFLLAFEPSGCGSDFLATLGAGAPGTAAWRLSDIHAFGGDGGRQDFQRDPLLAFGGRSDFLRPIAAETLAARAAIAVAILIALGALLAIAAVLTLGLIAALVPVATVIGFETLRTIAARLPLVAFFPLLALLALVAFGRVQALILILILVRHIVVAAGALLLEAGATFA